MHAANVRQLLAGKTGAFFVLHAAEQAMVRPAQLRTRCVPNWERQIGLPHLTNVSHGKPLPEFLRHPLWQILHQAFPILSAIPLHLHDLSTYLPASLDHGVVHRNSCLLSQKLERIANRIVHSSIHSNHRAVHVCPWRPRLALECAGIPRSWQKTTLVCCSKGPIRPCAPPSFSAFSVLPGHRDGEKSGFRMAPCEMAD